MKVKYLSLRKKLLYSVLAISTLVTSITVGLTFLFDYNQEINQLDLAMQSIEASLLKPLAKLAWDYNDNQIQTQLESITKLTEVASAKLTYTSNQKTFYVHDTNYEANTSNTFKEYNLTYDADGQSNLVAHLVLEFDRSHVISKLYDKALIYISLQFLKTFILSFVLLIIFQSMVTSRLEEIVDYLKFSTASKFQTRKHLHLRRQIQLFPNHDEINDMVRVINKMSYATSQYHQMMNKQIQDANLQIESERARTMYSNKMAALGEMASGIAHEINNPLAVIDGRLSLMQKYVQHLSTEENKKYLHDIESMKKMSLRISQIIRGLKSFARDGSQDPMTETQFQTILSDTNSLVQEKIKVKQIKYTYSKIDFNLQCRPVEISQVLLNLISNAIDAVENLPEKWIDLQVEDHNDYATIRIIDSGCGISDQIEDKIMQPFFTTKDIGKGTGLGLSISKGIIENHHGVLIINKTFTNTCFEIKIPKTPPKNNQLAS